MVSLSDHPKFSNVLVRIGKKCSCTKMEAPLPHVIRRGGKPQGEAVSQQRVNDLAQLLWSLSSRYLPKWAISPPIITPRIANVDQIAHMNCHSTGVAMENFFHQASAFLQCCAELFH